MPLFVLVIGVLAAHFVVGICVLLFLFSGWGLVQLPFLSTGADVCSCVIVHVLVDIGYGLVHKLVYPSLSVYRWTAELHVITEHEWAGPRPSREP
jgi:hypothetical protein